MTIKTPKNVVSASCTLDNLENCVATDLTAFTAKYFSKRQFLIPMSDADIALNFPAQFDIFQATTSNVPTTGGLAVTTSNLIGGNEVSCPFLMCGICLSITVESNLFALSCGEMAAPIGAALPAYDGVTPFVAPGPPPFPQPATLEYGHCSLRAALAFVESYSLRFLLQCKYELFDVPLSDIGCVDSDEVVGVGDSLIAAAIAFQRTNNQNLAIDSTRRAIPATTQALTAGGPQDALAFQPTTRVMIATLLEKGSLNGFYLCPTPILLAPCCRINMAFTEVGDSALSIGGESYQHQRLVEELRNVPVAPYGTDVPSVITGAPVTEIAVNRTLKFGALSIGVTMMGYEITPKACGQYFGNGLPDSLMAMYSMIQGMPGYQPALGTRASAPASGRTQKRANRRSSSPSRGAGEERRFRVSSRGVRG